LKRARLIQVKVKPNARVSQLEEVAEGSWRARVKSSPPDGKANAELIALIAGHFRCPRSSVIIKSGRAARVKLVQIEP
jgi:uncharacterized protein (TIGR00251 family)